jgi:hypothetical protein
LASQQGPVAPPDQPPWLAHQSIVIARTDRGDDRAVQQARAAPDPFEASAVNGRLLQRRVEV